MLKVRKYKPYIPAIVRPPSPETESAGSSCGDAGLNADEDDDDDYYSDGSLGSDEEPLTLEERLADAEKERIYLLKQIDPRSPCNQSKFYQTLTPRYAGGKEVGKASQNKYFQLGQAATPF